MNYQEIKNLIEKVSHSELTEVEIETGDIKIKLKKERTVVTSINQEDIKYISCTEKSNDKIVDTVEEIVTKDNVKVITSPMVGTFYSSPSPDSKSYVEVGQQVNKGDVLCILEAMKLMNEIESEYTGIVTKIYPNNEDTIEYDQPLFEIEIIA